MKTVIIDNYDSFTYNLRHLVRETGHEADVLRNDRFSLPELEKYDKIILSPGPGIPSEAGLLCDVISTYGGRKPILGVCLGHQAICEVFGAKVTYAKELMHGKQSVAELDTDSRLFRGMENKMTVARYHSLAAEAESFYRSVLAAKDRETLQTYLDCFSDQRRVELRAELPATLRQGLDTVLQQMKLPSITPAEENTQQKETGWQLDASTTWDDAAGSYTLRLETSSEAGGADAVIRYTLASELDAGSARLQYWAVDKTPQGWSQTMQNCPKVAAALNNGVLTASGFDFTTGKKLVVQLAGLQPARGSSFGGQGIPVGEGGVLQTVHETDYMVRYPAVGMDLPLNAPCFPVDQTIQDGQAVNFG